VPAIPALADMAPRRRTAREEAAEYLL